MDWRMRVTLQATRARGTDELRGREIASWPKARLRARIHLVGLLAMTRVNGRV